MKKIRYLVVLLLLLVLPGFFWFNSRYKPGSNSTLVIANKTLQVEIARTEAQRELGLSDKESLCTNCGMLFVFDQPGFHGFWMKRMHFDIDMIWINGNKIVDITHNAKKPTPEELESPKTIYSPKVAADKVLEVNAGWCEENGVSVGEELEF